MIQNKIQQQAQEATDKILLKIADIFIHGAEDTFPLFMRLRIEEAILECLKESSEVSTMLKRVLSVKDLNDFCLDRNVFTEREGGLVRDAYLLGVLSSGNKN